MGVEIERKFLVNVELLPELPEPRGIVQGYLSLDPLVRIQHVLEPGEQGFTGAICVKSKGGILRSEWEYKIPHVEANDMLRLCLFTISKNRYNIMHAGMLWEVDIFAIPCRDKWLAEVEIPTTDTPVELPPWVGLEVTGRHEYSNVHIAAHGWPE